MRSDYGKEAHFENDSETESIASDRTAFSKAYKKSTYTEGTRADDNNNEEYVEIILDIFDDFVAIHSVHSGGGGRAFHEDPELSSLAKKILENKSTSSVRSSLFRNTSWPIKHVFQELKRVACRRFDQTKSAAAHALKGLNFTG